MDLASTGLLADMWDTNGHMGGGWWIVMMFWWLFFSVLVIAGIIWVVRAGASPTAWRPSREATPLETLDRRFAEGAISVDEYHERRRVLTGTPDGPVADAPEPARH